METVNDESVRSVSIAVSDETQVGEARRAGAALAESGGFDETIAGRVALVISEAAMNLARHGDGGHIILRQLSAGRAGIEILAVDRGRGISDVNQAMQDGYSTAGSRGAGLGAIARQSSYFDVMTAPGAGTIVLSQVWRAGGRAPVIEFGAVCLPIPGESVCGDDWTTTAGVNHTVRLFLADGLGHGSAAHDAASDATRVFAQRSETSPDAALERVHVALRGGRGAAVAAAFLDPDRGCVDFAGLGNIAGVVRSDSTSKSMVSQNGTAGHNAYRLRSFAYDWPANAAVIFHSDGLTSHWTTDAFPGLLRRHPSLIAAALHRDFSRGRDDVTIIVARRASELFA
jgi:anti-sigma regulatory factor (Ser/Thr protein kinase)